VFKFDAAADPVECDDDRGKGFLVVYRFERAGGAAGGDNDRGMGIL
jgi:hypothetical protein